MNVNNYLMHYGINGQKWGIRRFENEDGTLTPAGKKRYEKVKAAFAKRVQKEGKKDYALDRGKFDKQYARDSSGRKMSYRTRYATEKMMKVASKDKYKEYRNLLYNKSREERTLANINEKAAKTKYLRTGKAYALSALRVARSVLAQKSIKEYERESEKILAECYNEYVKDLHD